MCSRARLVTYLPGLHVLVHRVAGARTFSTAGSLGFDEPHVAITTSDMGIPLIFMLLHIFSMLSVHPPNCPIFVNALSHENPERISSNLLELVNRNTFLWSKVKINVTSKRFAITQECIHLLKFHTDAY